MQMHHLLEHCPSSEILPLGQNDHYYQKMFIMLWNRYIYSSALIGRDPNTIYSDNRGRQVTFEGDRPPLETVRYVEDIWPSHPLN